MNELGVAGTGVSRDLNRDRAERSFIGLYAVAMCLVTLWRQRPIKSIEWN